ncbi:MAG TPA: ergothioneine biosynthesis protein EgtB [Acidimicrobiia bacterium]|nr:ergothioneine biosynthesis protein EgtB [Acidimicrobiia bacterium]
MSARRSLSLSDRATLQERYRSVRAFTDALAAPLSAEDQVVQSMPDVSPTKWHRAHTTWFFETFLLEPGDPQYAPFDPAYAYLFNSYYEAVGPRHPRPQRGLLSRPSVDDVVRYRAHVDAAMHGFIDSCDTDAATLIELGLHHEQQHQELLLMDIKHVLSCNPTDPAYDRGIKPTRIDAAADFVEFDAGNVAIGHAGEGFAFDNETPCHEVHLERFAIADQLVTAGEWLAFIADDGYTRPELWLSDGWYASQEHGWNAPEYWRDDGDDGWTVFTLAGRRALEATEPVVHVSHYEADAFARWRGARLPTEFEWEYAVASGGSSSLQHLDDEVWQWTSSAYLPYPRFHPAAGAVGEYNGKFMSGQMTLRGGACITSPHHTRPTYRNFFPPGSRWMYGGVRLARDTEG